MDKYTSLQNENCVKILKFRQLSVNSITLEFSLWVNVKQTCFNLFIGGNRVIVCSKTSLVRSDVYFFVQDCSILLQCSTAGLFQYTFVEIFTAKFKFIRGDVILRRHNIPVHLNSSLKRPSSLLSCCLCFTQHALVKKFATASAVKLPTQSFELGGGTSLAITIIQDCLLSSIMTLRKFFQDAERFNQFDASMSKSKLFFNALLWRAKFSRAPIKEVTR